MLSSLARSSLSLTQPSDPALSALTPFGKEPDSPAEASPKSPLDIDKPPSPRASATTPTSSVVLNPTSQPDDEHGRTMTLSPKPFRPSPLVGLDGTNIEHDLRVMLANGTSAPVEVLRNQVVTSLTLGMKPDWLNNSAKRLWGVTRKLVLGNSSSSAGDLTALDKQDPSDYRQLIMRLSDMKYVCIKAVVDVAENGAVDEREYWLPLERDQTVGDLKRLITGADGLEPPGGKLLEEPAEDGHDLAMVLRGRPLQDDNKTLQEEGLEHNAVVHLFVKKNANITVRMVGNKDLEVRVNADETAESLRKKLAALKPGMLRGHSTKNTQLYYGGRPLRDGPLSHYGVTDGATLELRPYNHAASGSRAPGGAHSFSGIGFGGFMHPSVHAGPGSGGYGSHIHHHGQNNPGSGGSGGRGGSGGGGGGGIPIPAMRQPANSWHHVAHGSFSTASTGGSGSDPPSPLTPPAMGSPVLAASFDRAREGLLSGKAPQLASGGTGGAYFLRDGDGETCAVFKPADEEPCARNNPRGRTISDTGEGLRKGTRVGEGAAREVAAYLLDHGGFAGVPATSLASLCEMKRSPSGNLDGKLGSLQAYVRADAEAEEYGPSLFPTAQVHKITQLDIRLANTDRNAGNILVQNGSPGGGGGGMTLVPIDHGYALPHTLEDVCFEWEFWKQARVPYDTETQAYIAALDVNADIEMLRANGIELQPSSERVLRVCTRLLQKAAAVGCCPADIASMMSRADPNRKSDLEKMTARAAAAAVAAVRAEDGLVMKPQPTRGSFWADLDSDERAESCFDNEMERLLDGYLEGFEPSPAEEEHL